MSEGYRHQLRVRYGEVDVQGHVFNAHYLAYVDDAADRWMSSTLGESYTDTLDLVVKRAELTWSGGAGFGDVLDILVAVRRWGNTSFDVRFTGSVDERPVFEATLTYVAVAPGTLAPTPVPADVRQALS